MEQEEILSGVLESIPPHILSKEEKKDITLQTSFTVLGFDSVDTVEVVSYAEKKFKVGFTEIEAQNIKDFEGLVLLVKKYL